MVFWSCRTLVSLWASEFLKPWNSLDRLRRSASVCSSLVWVRRREHSVRCSGDTGSIWMCSYFNTCRLFLSLSSSFLWVPARFALSFILHRQICNAHMIKLGMGMTEEEKQTYQTFPTRFLFPPFYGSGFWCPPPAPWSALRLPLSLPINQFSLG